MQHGEGLDEGPLGETDRHGVLGCGTRGDAGEQVGRYELARQQ
ncbi:hypothetical protein ACFOY4_38365 [Actinomadura syzygii]|nr:hypothetical protein [Actinomadura syzygii]